MLFIVYDESFKTFSSNKFANNLVGYLLDIWFFFCTRSSSNKDMSESYHISVQQILLWPSGSCIVNQARLC